MSARRDIHFHLLPAVDDGPATMEESIVLARLAVEDGTATVINTPHVCDVELDELEDRLEELRSELRRHEIPLEVVCGGELGAGDVEGLGNLELEGIAHGPEGARWVLLESPHDESAEEFEAAAAELRARGFGVVIAHPERSAALDHGLGPLIERELGAGSWLQVNGNSISGGYGEEVRRAAIELLSQQPRTIISSDAHGTDRPPGLSLAFEEAAEAGVEAERVRLAIDEAPTLLLAHGIRAT